MDISLTFSAKPNSLAELPLRVRKRGKKFIAQYADFVSEGDTEHEAICGFKLVSTTTPVKLRRAAPNSGAKNSFKEKEPKEKEPK